VTEVTLPDILKAADHGSHLDVDSQIIIQNNGMFGNEWNVEAMTNAILDL
jgi:hypothetical protein